MITGEEGILAKVNEAKEENEKAKVTDKVKFLIQEAQIDLLEKTRKNPTIKEMATYLQETYGDSNEIEITIYYEDYQEIANVTITDSSNGNLEPRTAIIKLEGWKFKILEDLKIDETYTKRLEVCGTYSLVKYKCDTCGDIGTSSTEHTKMCTGELGYDDTETSTPYSHRWGQSGQNTCEITPIGKKCKLCSAIGLQLIHKDCGSLSNWRLAPTHSQITCGTRSELYECSGCGSSYSEISGGNHLD